jgi:hypothetical protein
VGPAVRNYVNSLLDSHLLELQKITSGVVDLRSKNVKWYHFVNFVSNVIVLRYSLMRSMSLIGEDERVYFFFAKKNTSPGEQ